MKRTAIAVVFLMLFMSLPTSMAEIPAPTDNLGYDTLSVDGFVNTKFASVGSDVEIMALTRGHTDDTLVTAEILYYPMDPLDMMNSILPPTSGTIIDMVVLQGEGEHDDDPNTKVWKGTYIVPVDALGGVYGARIVAEDGCCLRAVDDSTQLMNLFKGEVSEVLESIADAWEEADPTMDISWEFESLDLIAANNGGWSTFVTVATEGQGSGGSEELWGNMIDAGRDQYDMNASSNFLEALMEFFASEDINASLALITGLMTYLHEFPLPRNFNDFDELADYLLTFDPIENFTRFEGTADFEAAYNALLGSNEWAAMEAALDDLANNRKPFEAAQTLLHNFALIAVSSHPQAITDGLMAFFDPLMEGDFENMTPVQKMIVRWIEMADYLEETDIQDTDGDEAPDNIIWQYEKLLETPEGQAWTAKMQTDSSWVNDVFDNFNSLPEDVVGHVFDAMGSLMESDVGPTVEEFGAWMRNATFGEEWIHWPNYDEEGDEENGEEGNEGEEEDQTVIFNIDDISTSEYDKNVLDIGVELSFWGPWDDSDYPSMFSMSMTNSHGDIVTTTLTQSDDDRHRYYGRMTASTIEDTVWTFSEPLENYEPDCADDGCTIDNAEIRLENLRTSMLASMAWENNDEIFIVSALGVLVDQDETMPLGSSYTVDSLSYDAAGAVSSAEVDIAILRLSPQLGEQAVQSLEPEGDVELTTSSGSIQGQYDGSDLDGDIGARITSYDEDRDEIRHPQAAPIDEIEIDGGGTYWNSGTSLDNVIGLVEVTTFGVTQSGLEFEIMKQLPLEGTPGCAKTNSGFWDSHVDIGWRYDNFRLYTDDGEEDFVKPDLDNLTIHWGDGDSTYRDAGSESEGEEWWGHDYSGTSGEEYDISIVYTADNGEEVWHQMIFAIDLGFYHEGSGEYRAGMEIGWCELETETSSIPTPEIIDSFITDGPFEVVKEEILTSDSEGKASITVTPDLPGVYVSIVQSKLTRYDGEVMAGVGMNFIAVTEASVSLGGLTAETTIAGIPVYSVETTPSGLATISISPTGLDFSETEEYTASLLIAPMDMSQLFSDVDEDMWAEPEDYELIFEEGDSSRSQEIRVTAPLSMIAVAIMSDESELFPTAMHMGVLVTEPGALELTGSLGPGQTTNIALSTADGEASRILAFAAPTIGFDPASIDLSSFSGLFYGEAVRTQVDWIAEENRAVETCERYDAWTEDGPTDNLKIWFGQEQSKYDPQEGYDFETSNFILGDADGNAITPSTDWYESWDEGYEASFSIDLNSEETYTLSSGTGIGDFEFTIKNEDGDMGAEYWVEMGPDEKCSGDDEMTEEEEFEMLDDFLGQLNSVAWGQGSSADLRLPVLAAPQDDYTVIAVAQVGVGEEATLLAALGSEIAVPNPEPPQLENLTLSFSPTNPKSGDMVLVLMTDEEGQPVDGLSVTLVRDNVTLFAMQSDFNGQVEFAIPTGTIVVKVSGGMFHPAELTIVVDNQGTNFDSDGDGVYDQDDQCPNTPSGTNVDSTGCEVVPVDSDGDGVLDDDDQCPNTPSGSTVDSTGCVPGSPDSDGDGVFDADDLCANTPAGATVDSTGCVIEPLDSDGDGVIDDDDQCPNTASGEVVDATGCIASSNNGDSGNNTETSTGKESASGLTDTVLYGGSAAIILLVVAVLLLTLRLRGERDEDLDWDESYVDDKWAGFSEPVEQYAAQDQMFNAPSKPSPNVQGEMQDGYEVTEYPENSGAWWYRDAESGQWVEWT